MSINHLQKNKERQSGFTILVAVVTAGVLLIVAMSIGGIALKEQVLSIANKESQTAFYAADTGMECALFWDQKKGAFTLDNSGNASASLSDITCNGIPMSPLDQDAVPPQDYTYSYTFMISDLIVEGGPNRTCAVVTVAKNTEDPNKTLTQIHSYGYNTCDASLNRLERGIEAHY